MNVVIIARALIPSILLCGHKQLEYLQAQGKLNYRFVPAARITDKDLSWADTIIFVRSESYLEYYASQIARKNGRHLIYVLDDDLLNVPRYVSSGPYYNRPAIKENIRKTMANCHTFLTTSPVMLERYGKDFPEAFLIDEPSLDVVAEKKENEKVRIGFAGSIDRTQDVNQILEESLISILEKYGDRIEIEFMGAHPDIIERYQLSYVPYQDSYERYTEVMRQRSWDIGLAPMPISAFHECKYFNKYVEYASCGTVGIYTDCKPYIYGIRDRRNGLLVKNETEAWVEALELLIENEDLRRQLCRECIREASERYSLPVLAEDYLTKILVGYEEKQRTLTSGLGIYRVKSFCIRLIDKIVEQKLRFPFWVIKYIYLKITGKQG